MIIGLTGSIASGKSTVSRRLAELGAKVFDADIISRSLTAPGGACTGDILARFGQEVFTADGALNRKRLAEIVFSDDEELAALNEIVHPKVFETLDALTIELFEHEPERVAVWDVALLFECARQAMVDYVWLVTAPKELRLLRIMDRDGCTREHAVSRINAQMPDAEKIPFADEVIVNDGDLASLLARVDVLYAAVGG